MKGIMFNNQYGMWEAVLLGLKTNTRRSGQSLAPINEHPDDWRLVYASSELFKLQNKKTNQQVSIAPRYRPGQLAYLQEPTLDGSKTFTDNDLVLYQYKDHAGCSDTDHYEALVQQVLRSGKRWGNKMFMPKEHARYFIEFTGVKLERFKSISDEDCRAEGVFSKTGVANKKMYRLYERNRNYKETGLWTLDPRASYASLISVVQESDECWKKNQWCFSYYFKLVPRPENLQPNRSYNEAEI